MNNQQGGQQGQQGNQKPGFDVKKDAKPQDKSLGADKDKNTKSKDMSGKGDRG